MPNYQPLLPLRMSDIDGAYLNISSIRLSVQQDLINLLLTIPGTHPMRPNVGVGLKKYLFELSTSPVWAELKQRIVNQVENYVDGVDILDVNVDFDLRGETVDNNTAKIKVTWQISRTADRSELSFELDQAREDILITSLPVDYATGDYETSDFVDGEWVAGRTGTVSGRPY